MAKPKAEQTYDLIYYNEDTGISGQPNESTIWTSYGNGQGGFVKGAALTVRGNILQVATGDFNGDGIIDIIDSANFVFKTDDGTKTGIGLSLGNDHGGFKYQNISTSVDIGQVSDLLPIDIDRDGDLDIIGRVEDGIVAGGKIAILRNNGSGKFAEPVFLSDDTSDGCYNVSTFDFDKDGDQDIFAIYGDRFTRYTNDGKGAFEQTAGASINGALPNDIIFIDIDGDGTKEIAATSGFRIDFLTTGLIIPGKFIDLENRPWAAAIAAGDVDGDGDQDLVSANNFTFNSETDSSRDISSVSIYTNDGKGNFSIKSIKLPEGSTPDTIQLKDVDHDGDLDIFTSDLGHANLLHNNGNGKFTVTTPPLPPGGDFIGVVTTQLNSEILGTAGNNRLNGTAAADLISGVSGNDRIYGGKGADVMSGGRGDDRFIFTALADSARGVHHDLITDFVHNQDLLDFSALNPHTKSGKFDFIGSHKFEHDPGEVRFAPVNEKGTANDHTIVEVDFNGDGKAEMQIEMTGLVHLDKGDFVL